MTNTGWVYKGFRLIGTCLRKMTYCLAQYFVLRPVWLLTSHRAVSYTSTLSTSLKLAKLFPNCTAVVHWWDFGLFPTTSCLAGAVDSHLTASCIPCKMRVTPTFKAVIAIFRLAFEAAWTQRWSSPLWPLPWRCTLIALLPDFSFQCFNFWLRNTDCS